MPKIRAVQTRVETRVETLVDLVNVAKSHARNRWSRKICGNIADSAEEMDWREMRARLIASQGFEAPTSDKSGKFTYETPLIEQGTILLGGTEMKFGFALRQQFFHKCVLLLLQHDEHFTKGIIML